MKYTRLNIILAIAILFSISSCTYRLVDFTIISSKNAELGVDKSKGKRVEAKKSYVFSIGWNIKDAMDLALEQAGPEYDLLIDGVVSYSNYPFVLVVRVKGTAVSSADLRASLGPDAYEEWISTQKVFDPDSFITDDKK